MMKYSKKSQKTQPEKTQEELDKTALEYLEKQLPREEIETRIKAIIEEFGGLISENGAMHVIARETGWNPPITVQRLQQETPMLTREYLEKKASITTEKETEDGKTKTYTGTWGSFIAVPAAVSETLTSSRGDTYKVVDLVGKDVEGVPLFLWREKALFVEDIEKIGLRRPMIFKSVLIKHSQDGESYFLSAANYFRVEPYEVEEKGD